jgi:hypothetical protein
VNAKGENDALETAFQFSPSGENSIVPDFIDPEALRETARLDAPMHSHLGNNWL